MKKALIYTLSLAMLLSALTACGNSPKQGKASKTEGSAGAVSSAVPDSSKAVVSEEDVRRLVLETDPEAKISAVVETSTEGTFAGTGAYEYGDGLFGVVSLSYDPVNVSEECKLRLAELNERNNFNGEGVLVFLEGEVRPAFYVEEETIYLTRTAKKKDPSKPFQIVYTIRDEETLAAYEAAVQQAGEELRTYANELEQLQYFISGSVEELNEEHHYVLLNGTAEQYSTGDYYQGKIRLDYSKEGEEWITQDNIYGVAAFSWRDEETRDDGEWSGYKGFNSAKGSFLGYSLEQTYQSIDGGVEYILKLLKNTPPLEGVHYEEALGDWLLRFTVPEEWKDICDIETAENVVSFYQKASRAEMGGWLFDLAVMEGAGYLEIPHYEIVAEEEGVTLLAVFPTDVQFDGNAMAEYEEMQARIVEILDSVEFERK